MVLEEAERLEVIPRLGVRARLASQGSGKWQASGGEKSKFGLAATQVLQLIDTLRQAGRLDSLQLLHFHLGSQMANIRDIATGVRESARFYVELHKLGVNIQYFDVGGGLGVDYEGTRSQSDCSVNYGLNEYANNVIWAIGDACDENELPHPTVITESGRALTAHHTVLISNVIGVERNEFTAITPPAEDAPRPIASLWETWEEMQTKGNSRSLREWLHDSQLDLHDVHTQYVHGMLSLTERAWAEELYLNICRHIQYDLDPSNRAHRPIIDELQERMSDKFYVNFSLFQSLPDAWGIDQLFPVLPIEGLDKPLDRRAVLLDITCDSDGIIDHYVDGDGVETTMPMPAYDPEYPPMIGFFMVGAYQEILGNMHNLFGDTAAVDVYLDDKGNLTYQLSEEGDTVADMLQYVKLNPAVLLERFRTQVKNAQLDKALQEQFLTEFESGLYGYTYLEEEE
ncbi:arginine decarboxylase [Proteus mirabilis]|uniref:arginine decarboxylase n=3 Tax=Morganellaceae TaxID=1903414 RepID=A0A2X2C1H3_PROMI|nr:arginine decarboxylase [Proteus mirabilis]